MANGKIEAFIDCVSFYSVFAFEYLQRNHDILKSHGIEIEFSPFFLGGVNAGSGNKPPWTLPAKAKYSKFDGERAKKYFGLTNLQTPDVFPILSVLPQRCATYIKDNYPEDKFYAALHENFVALWQDNLDISKPDILTPVLARTFGHDDAASIIVAAQSSEYKKKLQDQTQRALDQGAFGAPWFWVTNREGKQEPFFGSDRFHFMWEYLGLPWQDIAILEKPKL